MPERCLPSLASNRIVTLLCSRFTRDEAVRNIELKFLRCREALAALLEVIEQVPEPPPSLIRIAISAGLPDKDAPILAAAIAVRVDVLVTGDKRHFGNFFGHRMEGVLILPPADTLALVLAQAPG